MTTDNGHRSSVSVVIPNYNGQHLLAKNLPAVFAALTAGDEVVIIDDASTDDSWRWLNKVHASNGTSLSLLKNDRNLRFAATCNRGVTAATHDLIFLLNSDVSPHADVLTYLVPHFDDTSVFAVGCLEQEQKNGQRVQGGKNKLWFERGMFVHSRADNFNSGLTAWVSGGSGMFHKPKWVQLGGFDEAYAPAYWEDVDLSFRARAYGWKILFESKAIVDHNHESTNQDVFGQQKIARMSWKNGQKFVWKNGMFTQKLLYLIWQPYWLIQWKKI